MPSISRPLAVLLLAASAVFAETPATQPTTSTSPPPKPFAQKITEGGDNLSVTHHQFTVAGAPFAYTATAGTMKLKDESGKPRADFFYTAYVREGVADGTTRSVAFVFNGGPGAASVWLHLGTVGPKRVDVGPQGEVGPAPYKALDNAESWLPETDLVFIDPVGTGYSRPADGVKQEEFSGAQNDIASVGEFIRLYLTRNNRWGSPVFLVGESYGTTRAAGLSSFLADRYGISVNGVILISSVLNFQTLDFSPGNDLGYELYVPTYAALAFKRGKLMTTTGGAGEVRPSVQKVIEEATAWMKTQYVPALMAGSRLGADDRKKIAKQLALYTGLTEEEVDRLNLRVSPGYFRKRLLQDKKLIIGRFDGGITGFDQNPESGEAAGDPSYPMYQAIYTATFNQYIRNELGYVSDAPYEVLTGRVGRWDFGQGGNGFYDVSDDIRAVMIEHPAMRIFVACGHADLATPLAAAEYTFDRLDLPAELRKNITFAYYSGGHMMYHVTDDRVKLHNDAKAFIAAAARR